MVPATAADKRTGRPIPQYCKVLGALEKTILFEVSMPTEVWNGKFMFAGGGSFNGSIPGLTHILSRGYAAAGTDTGHQAFSGSTAWALNNPKAQLDYGHRATHLVTVLAKTIVREYYGKQAARNYWLGCSNGGKMGLMELQRYPDDYDGAIVGAPGPSRTRLFANHVWNAQAVFQNPIPDEKIPAIDKATLAACDAKDGLVDGLIDRPERCQFDPKVLTCKSDDRPDCLTPGQVATLKKLYSGARDSSGQPWFYGYAAGHEEDYPVFWTGEETDHTDTARNKRGAGFYRDFIFGATFDGLRDFDWDKTVLAPEVARVAADQDAADPNLSSFKAHGGKVIMYHGWADHSISPYSSVAYYENVVKTVAGADDFVRLFMVPGLHHCSAGPGPIEFGGSGQRWANDDAEHDVVRALERWVEADTAPEKIIGTKFVDNNPKKGVARTRPLCPYPLMAKYKGSGSIDDAANFVCGRP